MSGTPSFESSINPDEWPVYAMERLELCQRGWFRVRVVSASVPWNMGSGSNTVRCVTYNQQVAPDSGNEEIRWYEILRIKYQMVSVNRLYGGGDDDDDDGGGDSGQRHRRML